jgi:steroid delta-isomerase-like uncharacterized protein
MDAGADKAALREARVRRVEEHVRHENAHDLDAVMDTFLANPFYDEEPWGEHHIGHQAVRKYYEQLFRAAPDLCIDIRRRHATDDAVILECEISGTQEGAWRGLPPTGRRISFPICAVYEFEDDGDKLAGERIYYDRATVLNQLGVLHEPESLLGRVLTVLTHPVTLGSAVARRVRSQPPR